MNMNKSSVLIIYTGGTIGMVKDAQTGALVPLCLDQLVKHIPLDQLDYNVSLYSFTDPIDSSNMSPAVWVELANVIEDNYLKYDGFVILHGTDTMSYTASALSFMLHNLNKPVIFTGSQLPIGLIRTDGRENLITALEIASHKEHGEPLVREVCILFDEYLYRANRTHKFNAENFDAFICPNFPPLAEIGIHIKYNKAYLSTKSKDEFYVTPELNDHIAILQLYPGIRPEVVEAILSIPALKGVILESYGNGNTLTDEWFIDKLAKAIDKGIVIYNVTHCEKGTVDHGKYQTSVMLDKIGVCSGKDITLEAAITKMMYLLTKKLTIHQIKNDLERSLCGEITA